MIRCNKRSRAIHLINNDMHHIFDFLNSLIAGRENSTVRSMAGFIDLIMVDINNVHAFYHSLTLFFLDPDDVAIFQS